MPPKKADATKAAQITCLWRELVFTFFALVVFLNQFDYNSQCYDERAIYSGATSTA